MRLRAQGISFSYTGDKPVLTNVDFSLEGGEIAGIFAPSGFGKTTLAKILAGYLAPKAGKVTIEGAQDCSFGGYHPVQLIFQHPEKAVNPKWKMRKIMSEAAEPPRELIKAMGIKESWLDRWPTELSGGELQRFCVLRVLNEKTRFLIADEMTSMLDAVTQVQIWDAVLGYAKEHRMGVAVISHDRMLLERICDRIVEL
jgi:peptide/nickel transport system ATP-binding protein